MLGTGGMAPADDRETACTLVRNGRGALLLDCGTGARRLLTDPALLDGVRRLDILLTHFHLDHICGLTYLESLRVDVTIWAPGAWLYGAKSASLVMPVRVPPISPTDVSMHFPIQELRAGDQTIGGFDVHAVAQPRHWAPSAGLRVDDVLALVTDTPYESTSAVLAHGVAHLLHEAWSSSEAPQYADYDATAADAALVARQAKVGQLTLVHLNPALRSHAPLLADALRFFDRTRLGEDNAVLPV